MHSSHHSYCERSAALGEGFPDLVGGAVGLAVGLVRGSVLAARKLAEDAIWMTPGSGSGSGSSCSCSCATVHRVHVSDCGPCVHCSGCCCGR